MPFCHFKFATFYTAMAAITRAGSCQKSCDPSSARQNSEHPWAPIVSPRSNSFRSRWSQWMPSSTRPELSFPRPKSAFPQRLLKPETVYADHYHEFLALDEALRNSNPGYAMVGVNDAYVADLRAAIAGRLSG